MYLSAMANLVRMRVVWSGSGVTGPGLTTFYTPTTGTGLPAAVKAFFTTLAPTFPTSVTWTIPQDGDTISDATGDLTGTWSEPSGGGQVSGSVSTAFARGVGAQVRWSTGGLRGGRRVIGSTFLVPLATGAYDTDGSLQPTTVTLLSNAANTLHGAASLMVWSRPSARNGAGTSSAVTGVQIPDRVSWLRTRRT